MSRGQSRLDPDDTHDSLNYPDQSVRKTPAAVHAGRFTGQPPSPGADFAETGPDEMSCTTTGTMTDAMPASLSPRPAPGRATSIQTLPSLRSMFFPPMSNPQLSHSRSASDSPHAVQSLEDNPRRYGGGSPTETMSLSPRRFGPLTSSFQTSGATAGAPTASRPQTTSGVLGSASGYPPPHEAYHYAPRAFDPPGSRFGERGIHIRDESGGPSPATGRSSNPRASYVGEMSVEGKGLCHVYNNGEQLPAYINGNRVHPGHGVTKTGNPAKRTSTACLSCRGKKVKCEANLADPSQPCLSCAKGGHECQWGRGNTRSPDSSLRPRSSPRPGTPLTKRRATSSGAVSEASRTTEPQRTIPSAPASASGNSRDNEPPPAKRPKFEPQSPVPDLHDLVPSSVPSASHSVVQISSGETLSKDRDPYETHPVLTMQLLDNFFRYHDHRTTLLIPRAAFTEWVRNCRSKSARELVVLYACLAVGSKYIHGLKAASADVAVSVEPLEAELLGEHSLQLVHAMHHLATYFHAHDRLDKSFEMLNSAVRIACLLRYNTEQGCAEGASDDPALNDYGLSKSQLIECRRRSFWYSFMGTRYVENCLGRPTVISDDDIFVRLPCNEDDYAADLGTQGPPFRHGNFDMAAERCGEMGYLVGMMTIWRSITTNTYRETHGDPGDGDERYETFYADTVARIGSWEASLPEGLRFGHANAYAALRDHRFSSYYSIQACRLLTLMKLNRCCRATAMTGPNLRRNVRAALHYARELLSIVTALSKVDLAAASRNADVENALWQPLPSYAIVVACDIISRGGPASSLDETALLVSNVDNVIVEVARIFRNVADQRRLVQRRVREFGAHKMRPARGSAPWSFREPIDTTVAPADQDAIYGISDQVYFEAIA